MTVYKGNHTSNSPALGPTVFDVSVCKVSVTYGNYNSTTLQFNSILSLLANLNCTRGREMGLYNPSSIGSIKYFMLLKQGDVIGKALFSLGN